eukprot:15331057-Ditylum_brightwellii.AAC.1
MKIFDDEDGLKAFRTKTEALKQFKTSVCLKEFWQLRRKKELLAKGKKLSNEEGKDIFDEEEDNDDTTATTTTNFKGLGT